MRDLAEAGGVQGPGNRVGLISAVLEQQPAAGLQVTGCRCGDVQQGVQALAARDQGQLRLVAQRGQVRVAFGDIGRVADQQVDSFAPQRRQPVPLAPVDLQAQPLAIASRDGQRRVLGRCF